MGTDKPGKDQIFNTAAEIEDPAERAVYLDEACRNDALLRAEIEELLRHDQENASFLESPPFWVSPTVNQSIAEGPGSVIGPYKLLQQIGEGGFGVVYMAEQSEPVERRIALKIIKPGMDSRQVIARFEAERQALAMMDHPNIAKVYDAGTTESSRPYFVMELVKGIPITQYCDEHRLSPRQRLELFVPVCQAVQHAHQKGIIHRDIKPSNIMVAEYDDRAVPKIIDFGVAKATEQRLTAKTMFTQLGQVMGTVDYMSPEQAKLNQLDIDTRSDIYSLGVVLYELLTGETPFDRRRLRSAAFDELLRIIREEEPPRPSTRLSTSQSLPAIAAKRQIEPKKLGPLVRGELDWIVMKALEKDRTRRYETANGLAADIRRYLADEPVIACPPSAAYRLRKLVRKNRKAVTLSMVFSLMLAVCIAVVGVSIGWAARDKAARQALLEQQIIQALEDVQESYTQHRMAQAQAEVKHALGLMAVAGGGNEEISERVKQWHTDLETAIQLEKIRLEKEDVRDENFDTRMADRAYHGAFVNFGLDVEIPSSVATVERIAQSNIKDRLVAALDDWVTVKWLGKLENVDTIIEVARQADPDPWRNRLRSALQHENWDDLKDLIQNKDLLEQPPATILLLAILLKTSNHWDAAVDVLKSAQRQHPGDFWINYYLGRYLSQKHPEDALGFCRAALAVRPDESGAYSCVARALHWMDPELGWQPYSHIDAITGWQEYRSEAIYQLRVALRLNPDHHWAHANLAAKLILDGKGAEAESHIRAAIQLCPSQSHFYRTLRAALLLQNRPKDAASMPFDLLGTAIEANPSNMDLRMVRAELYTLYARPGDWQKAAADYNAVAKNLPDSAYHAYCYSAVLLLADDSDSYRNCCMDMFDRFHTSQDKDKPFWLVRACVLGGNPGVEPDRIVRIAEEIATAQPPIPWGLHVLGMAYFRAGKLDEANRLLKEGPSNHWNAQVLGWLSLALVEHHQGNAAEAARWLNKAVAWMEQETWRHTTPRGYGYFPISTADQIAYWALRREAESLINPEEM
ncbi:MAG: protein kinase [Pirellulales bacterium]|nr:protein kinase [Pirellulales bacterium]